MSGWTLFFTVIGVLVMTAQLFRIIDAIERPAHSVPSRKPAAPRHFKRLRRVLPWMSWKN